jgi:hypothetical protein
MAADVFSGIHAYNLLDSSEAELSSSPESKGPPAIFLRKLPSNSDNESVRNILLFAGKDLIDCEIVKHPHDKGYASAVAKFCTLESAKEARDLLNGKRNATNEAELIVELVPDGFPGTIGSRRNTVDSTAGMPRGAISAANAGRLSSRYNGTFQSMERISPPNGTPGLGNGEFPVQNLFSPTSPVCPTFNHPHRNLGKTVINDEADDEDGLLQESVGYATSAQAMPTPIGRRTTNPNHISIGRFASLSINTNGVNGMNTPQMQSYSAARSAATIQSPSTTIVGIPTMSAMSAHPIGMNGINGMNNPSSNGYQYPQQYPRHQYPPVNPADQNPPCNTLYVGNLPIDTSEDELKAMFSKQRGYKRLCFRTKNNGPMCFVEFEDVSFATKALNELYGHPLHNSIKGGIRLSFSKNPLGVRANQAPGTPAVPQAGTMNGYLGNVTASPGFATATGPPPGLSVPPGLRNAHASGPGFSMYSNGGFGMPGDDLNSPNRHHPQSAVPLSNGAQHHPQSGGPMSNGTQHHPQSAGPMSNGAQRHPQSAGPMSNGAQQHPQSGGPTSNGAQHHPQSGGPTSNGAQHHPQSGGPMSNGGTNGSGGLNGGYNPYNMPR